MFSSTLEFGLKMRSCINKFSESPILRAFLTTSVGSGVSKVILVIATFYCARLLSKEDFGTFSFVRNTLNTILCVCALNYIGLCTKFTSELVYIPIARVRLAILIAFSLFVCALFGGVLFLLPKSIMINLLGGETIVPYFRLIGILLPLLMVQPLIEGILRGKQRFKTIGIMQIISSLSFLILIIFGIYIHEMSGAIIGMLIYYVLYSIYSLIVLNRITSIKYCFVGAFTGWRSELSIIHRMILPVFLLSFIEAPINWWAQLLLTQQSSYEAIGSMTAIMQIRNIVILIPAYFLNAFTSFASSLNANNSHIEYFNKFKRTMTWFFIGSSLVVILLICCRKILLGLYGPAYTTDSIPFVIAIIAMPLYILCSLLKVNLLIREHQQAMLCMSILGSFLFISGLYILLHVNISSVSAFFIAQFLQISMTLIWCMQIYIKDKRTLLKNYVL